MNENLGKELKMQKCMHNNKKRYFFHLTWCIIL